MTATQPRNGQWAAARRAAANAMHPDRGGDATAFIAALAAIDDAYRLAQCQTVSVIVGRPRLRWWISLMRRVMRRVPGNRHTYARL